MSEGYGQADRPVSGPVRYEFEAGRRTLGTAFEDFREGLKRIRLAVTMVGAEFTAKYRGTFLGVFWLTVTSLMTIVGLGIVYSQVFQSQLASYLPYVGTGMILWGLISTTVTEGASVFSGAHAIRSQVRLPLSLFVFVMIGRAAVVFALRGLVIIPMLLLNGSSLTGSNAAAALAGLFLIFWIGYWTAFPLGLLGARFRDVGQLAATFITIAFFLTPVFWQAERLGDWSSLVMFNPFHHFINVVRGPLLGLQDVQTSFAVSTVVAIALPAIAILCIARFEHRLAYW